MEKSYFGFHFKTFCVATVIAFFATILEVAFPFTGFISAVMFFGYLGYRNRELYALKVRDNHPDAAETVRLLQNYDIAVERYDSICNGGAKIKCRTCDYGHMEHSPTTCQNPDLPNHDVYSTPPEYNPYAYWWYQCNGYPPPYIVRSTNDNYFDIKFFKAEGKKYYSQHPNHAWDSGIVNPPEWYMVHKLSHMLN